MLHIISTSQQPESFTELRENLQDLIQANPSIKGLVGSYIGQGVVQQLLTGNANFTKEAEQIILAYARELIITPAQLHGFRSLFGQHYTDNNGQANAFDDLRIGWQELSSDINSTTNPISAAYRFIHRYNPQENYWFLTAQATELTAYGQIGMKTTLKLKNDFFDITFAGYGSQTDMSQLTNSNGNYLDQAYLTNVISADGYDPDLRVHGMNLPAQELRAIISHNLSYGGNEADYDINFSCVTSQLEASEICDINNPSSTCSSYVEYPHSLAIYASYPGGPCLGNGAVIGGAVLRGNAANFDSLCPPNCKTYFWPNNLPA